MPDTSPKRPPVTYFAVSGDPWPDQRPRWDELDLRHHMVRSHAILEARGEYDPAKHGPADKYQPLSLDERLEMLARGEVIARHYRHPTQIDWALRDGATWRQIAEAVDRTEEQVRAAYREWAEGQHRLWTDHDGKLLGLDDAQYAEALARLHEGSSDA